MLERFWPLALAAVGAASAHAAQRVHVVGPSDGGIEFIDLQPLVDAAGEGDVILLEAGQYIPFVVDGKSLTVAAAPGGHDPKIGYAKGMLTVRNLAADQAFALRDVDVFYGWCCHNVRIDQNQGAVRIIDADLWPNLSSPPSVTSSIDLVLTRSETTGSATPDLNHGDAGLLVTDSRLFLYGSRAIGMRGDPPTSSSSFVNDGGPGVHLFDSQLFASATTFIGGQGSTSDNQGACTATSKGGDGVWLDGTTGAALFRGCIFQPGEGSHGYDNYQDNRCPPGIHGRAVATEVAPYTLLPDEPSVLRVDPFVAEGGALVVEIVGAPGEAPLLWISAEAATRPVAYGAWSHVGDAPSEVPLAALPPSGVGNYSVPLPEGWSSPTVHVQALLPSSLVTTGLRTTNPDVAIVLPQEGLAR